MKRRDFIKTGLTAGLAAGAGFSLLPYQKMMARNAPVQNYDLAAIKGGSPVQMFDRGMKAMGGMGRFVKKGQTVVVKPNIGWSVPPERAANTNPDLVKRIIQHCYQAGAKVVYVFDNTCDNWIKAYQESGIEKAAKEANAKVAPGNSERYYHEVSIPGAKVLKSTKVHELILESDVFINVPILKHHGSADLTIAIKNLMGVIWDRRYWHRNDLHQCIADYGLFHKRPHLNVVDAYRVLMKNGPRGISINDVQLFQSQIIAPDMVAADSAAAALFGKKADEIKYITIADEMKIGTKDLTKLKIARLNI